ncbi:hypothetical protein PG987_011088 [Apiospora arundinis]
MVPVLLFVVLVVSALPLVSVGGYVSEVFVPSLNVAVDEEEAIVSGYDNSVVWDGIEELSGRLGDMAVSILLVTSGIEGELPSEAVRADETVISVSVEETDSTPVVAVSLGLILVDSSPLLDILEVMDTVYDVSVSEFEGTVELVTVCPVTVIPTLVKLLDVTDVISEESVVIESPEEVPVLLEKDEKFVVETLPELPILLVPLSSGAPDEEVITPERSELLTAPGLDPELGVVGENGFVEVAPVEKLTRWDEVLKSVMLESDVESLMVCSVTVLGFGVVLAFGSDVPPEVGATDVNLDIGVAYEALVRSEVSGTEVVSSDDALAVVASGNLVST